MKTQPNIDKHTPKRITTGFNINEDLMYLRVKAKIGDKEVLNERGNSLLKQFLSELAVMFNGGTDIYDTTQGYSNNKTRPLDENDFKNSYDAAPVCCRMSSPGSWAEPDARFEEFTITAWDGDTVTFSSSNFSANQEQFENLHAVCIVGGNYAGNYLVTGTSGASNTGGTVTLQGLNVNTGDPIDGTLVIAYKYRSSWYDPNGLFYERRENLGIVNLFVGNSTQAVTRDDIFLPGYHDDSVFAIGTGYPALATPTIVNDNSRIAITQSFQNVSGTAQTISEFGLATNVRDAESDSVEYRVRKRDNTGSVKGRNGISLIARDVVTPFQVAAGETVTITYELVTQASGNAGVVAGFLEMLYRQFSLSDRTARNYFNIDWTSAEANGGSNDFAFFDEGGAQYFMYPWTLSTETDSSFHGIQVGTSEDTVDIDDYFLRDSEDNPTRINHGSGDGMLFYHPTRVRNIVDEGSSTYLEFECLVENQGSTDVTIKEVGLTGGYSLADPVLLSRNILSSGDWVTLSQGQIAKIVYRIGITISN